MPAKITALTIERNNHYIAGLFASVESSLGVSFDKLESVKLALQHYFTEKNIDSMNLQANEENQLKELITTALLDNKQAIEHTSLDAWLRALQFPVVGAEDRSLLDRHMARTNWTFADELVHTGQVSHANWGTDRDVIYALGHLITRDPSRNITAAGSYILSPVSLTNSIDPIRDHLQESLRAVTDLSINDHVSVYVPVNCGNNHWCLAKFEIENQTLVSATLWDSLSGDKSASESTLAYKNLQTVVHETAATVTVSSELTGIQKNGYSCMDYSIQEALSAAGHVDHPIVKATNAADLRLAVVKEIAHHHPVLNEAGIADSLTLEDVGEVSSSSTHQPKKKIAIPEVTADDTAFVAETLKDKKKQIKFDEVFSRELNALYKKFPEKSEKELEKKAFAYAYRMCGLFDDKIAKSTHSKPLDDTAKPAHKKML